jgi:catechol 2,3-dioxygenase-like lactoylglutathione lyase family enzyme
VRGISGRPAYAVVMTSDLTRALRFYADLLGLSVISRDEYGCFLEAGGTEVRLSLVDAVPSGPGTVLGWRVPDVAATAAWLEGLGVAIEHIDGRGQDAAGIWASADGARLAWFRDPDGNLLSLLENSQR